MVSAMEVLNTRTALLSNYEVLMLLKENEKRQLEAEAWTSMPENVRTVQSQTIEHLTSENSPTKFQTPASIQYLVQGLGQFQLTKAEKLMITNLMPISTVALYPILEEFEERFQSGEPDAILQLVREAQAMADAEGVAINGLNQSSTIDRDVGGAERAGEGGTSAERGAEVQATEEVWTESMDGPEDEIDAYGEDDDAEPEG